MCILFYHAKKLSVPGKFRVIIISNRDEFYKRPTATGHFWKENSNVFGGKDLKAEDHGTWLALNKCGRLAILLNITSGTLCPGARSRGHLVTDFVNNTKVTGPDYQKKVAQHASEHNPFHLLTMEILPEDVRLSYVAHQKNGSVLGPKDVSPVLQLTQSLSNSPLPCPYKKAEEGAKLFQAVIDELDDTSQRETLISSLTNFAKTQTRFWPDHVLAEHTHLEPHLESFSSIFVHIPEIGYGTRTHTVILVDDTGRVDVLESTMQMNEGSETDNWLNTRETFQIQQED